ncbi:MAG: D-glycerate dehydrogenase [Methanobacteriota archaeon]|nr:MAG: D-glycerate dehydrogenase [Euryarchaeota archaeon]HIM33611.1 D-glycerate dehydrogenase [Candidatus Poseidoniales archaeon]
MKVLVTRRLPETVMGRLEKANEITELRVNPHDRTLTRDELEEGTAWCDILLSQLVDPVDAALMDCNSELKLIANYAVGYNNIDVPAATERGIPVTNTPGVLDDSTADLTWVLLMAVARRIVEADRYMRGGEYEGWAPTLLMGTDVHHKTLGIVGLGRIGFALAQRARGFDMRILYSDLELKPYAEEVGAEYVDMYTLLRQSDFVSLHPFYDKKSHHLIDTRELREMKRSAFLINVSRGPVVNEKALVKALKAGEIAGAALDVYEREPAMEPELAKMDNVVIVPHIASASLETRTAMGNIAVDNVLARCRGDALTTCLNPEAVG